MAYAPYTFCILYFVFCFLEEENLNELEVLC